MHGRFSEGDVLIVAGRKHLHFVEMEVTVAGKLKANEAASPALQIDLKRLAVGMAPEIRAVVLINLPELLAVVAKTNDDVPIARAGAVAAVVKDESS